MKYRRAFALLIASLLINVPALAGCPASLFISVNGVAFSKFPSRSILSKSVAIGPQTVSGETCWQATSSAAWLHLQPSASNLLLTAQPTGLQQNVSYLATVTVKSLPSGQTTQIRVGLWVGSKNPATVTQSQPAASIAANPVQPVAYVSGGSTSVAVFNVYTGQRVRTFNPIAPTVGALVVSSDGTQLFAVDTTNYRILAISTATGTVSHTFQLVGPISSDFSFAYARPGGRPTLLAPGQSAIDVATGKAVSSPITSTSGFYDPLLVATPNGAKLAVVERGLSPGSLYTYSVSVASGLLTIKQIGSTMTQGGNCQALAMTANGSRLYPACGWPYQFDVYDGTTLQQIQTLTGVPYPDDATIDSAGDFVGGADGVYQADDVFVFNPAGYEVGAVPTTSATYSSGQGDNLLATSGDSTRVITATPALYGSSSQTLVFRNLP